jgi:predicted transposase/invertase (TIGR01784 family)
MIPHELEEPKELREAFEVAKQMSWSKEELEAYDDRGIYIQDERGRLDYALEEGKRIGVDEGKKEGIKEGEKNKAKEMAKAMKKEGEPVEKILKYTGLARKEIEVLE